MIHMLTASWKGIALPCVLVLQAAAHAGDLERAAPKEVGLSVERLQRLDAVMQAEIDAGRKAGIAVLVARRSKVVNHRLKTGATRKEES